MNTLKKCSIIILKIILFYSFINPAHSSMSSNDLIPVKISHDLPIERDNPDGNNYDLQPFKDTSTKLMGYKNKDGKIVIKPRFDEALNFSKAGIADVFLKPNKWYKIDISGKKLYQSYFFDNGPDYYVSGLMRFVKNGKIGFADGHGQIVIPASFDFANPFSYTAPVTIVCKGCQEERKENYSKDSCHHPEITGGKWGMINNKGDVVVPIEFDSHEISEDGVVNFLKGDYVLRVYWKASKSLG